MVVASANEFRTNQKKYLDLVKQDIQVFLKRGSDIFAITSISSRQHVNINPVWVEHMKKAEQDIRDGKVTAIKSSDVWKKVKDMNIL
jgi:hypothetical protein